MSSPRLIKLRNGVVFDIDAIRLIARKDLNEYNIVLEGTGVMPRADADDVEFIEKQFDLIMAPPTPIGEGVAVPSLKTKLAVEE